MNGIFTNPYENATAYESRVWGRCGFDYVSTEYCRERRRKCLRMGDRLFVRVILRGEVVLEFMTDRVADMTELVGEVRHAGFGLSGLSRLQVRNHSRGWSLERPLMFYPPSFPKAYAKGMNRPATRPCADSGTGEGRTMYFPWETH